jgi:hypothetical protein
MNNRQQDVSLFSVQVFYRAANRVTRPLEHDDDDIVEPFQFCLLLLLLLLRRPF